jgi:hypothetical protein
VLCQQFPPGNRRGGAEAIDHDDYDDEETEAERWQRNYMELLQELRVVQMGVQILFAFLLTLAFSDRFDRAGTFSRVTYVVALLAAAAATALLIAPVAFHRAVFRQHRKPSLVLLTHRMAWAGLGLLLVAAVSAVMLAVDLVATRWIAVVVAVFIGAWFAGLWLVGPLSLRRRSRPAPIRQG